MTTFVNINSPVAFLLLLLLLLLPTSSSHPLSIPFLSLRASERFPFGHNWHIQPAFPLRRLGQGRQVAIHLPQVSTDLIVHISDTISNPGTPALMDFSKELRSTKLPFFEHAKLIIRDVLKLRHHDYNRVDSISIKIQNSNFSMSCSSTDRSTLSIEPIIVRKTSGNATAPQRPSSNQSGSSMLPYSVQMVSDDAHSRPSSFVVSPERNNVLSVVNKTSPPVSVSSDTTRLEIASTSPLPDFQHGSVRLAYKDRTGSPPKAFYPSLPALVFEPFASDEDFAIDGSSGPDEFQPARHGLYLHGSRSEENSGPSTAKLRHPSILLIKKGRLVPASKRSTWAPSDSAFNRWVPARFSRREYRPFNVPLPPKQSKVTENPFDDAAEKSDLPTTALQVHGSQSQAPTNNRTFINEKDSSSGLHSANTPSHDTIETTSRPLANTGRPFIDTGRPLTNTGRAFIDTGRPLVNTVINAVPVVAAWYNSSTTHERHQTGAFAPRRASPSPAVPSIEVQPPSPTTQQSEHPRASWNSIDFPDELHMNENENGGYPMLSRTNSFESLLWPEDTRGRGEKRY